MLTGVDVALTETRPKSCAAGMPEVCASAGAAAARKNTERPMPPHRKRSRRLFCVTLNMVSTTYGHGGDLYSHNSRRYLLLFTSARL